MHYTAKDGKTYQLGLMDTRTRGLQLRGLAQSRGLRRCGATASMPPEGVEARTVATPIWRSAGNLKVVPVINKIDLPSANLELCLRQMEDILTIAHDEAILASGKAGIGIGTS